MADDHSPAETLLHPARFRIVQALLGRALTTQELRAELSDISQASLYRHVARLADAGLLHVTDERTVRGGIERTYAVVESAVELGPEAFASATPEDHTRYFATFVGAVLASFERYVRSVEPDARVGTGLERLRYEQIALWLTDAELAEATLRWIEILEPLRANGPTGGRRRMLLSQAMFPDATRR